MTVDPAALPAGLIAELADAEARLMLARRFHNDAVRDTLALAERRPVRALRLGGTATLTIEYQSYQVTAAKPVALARKPIPSTAGFGWPDGGANQEVANFMSRR